MADADEINRQLRDVERAEKARENRNERIAEREFRKLSPEQQAQAQLEAQLKEAEQRGYDRGMADAMKAIPAAVTKEGQRFTLNSGQGIQATGFGFNWTIAEA